MVFSPPAIRLGWTDRPVNQTYKDLMTDLLSGSSTLEKSNFVMEKTIKDVKRYVEEFFVGSSAGCSCL